MSTSTLRGAYIDENGVRWVRNILNRLINVMVLRMFIQDTNDADFEGNLLKKSKWMGGNINRIYLAH